MIAAPAAFLTALHDAWLAAAHRPEERACRRLSEAAPLAPRVRRAYLYHVRKTGGTSLVFSLLSCAGEDGAAVYRRLREQRNGRTLSGDRVFVGWRRRLIERGRYHFAFSHLPSHAVALPADTFAFTCLRDPAQRVLSHYRMLSDYASGGAVPRTIARDEMKWLGRSFDDFLDNLPREHLHNQLFMFSPTYDVDEAHDRIRALPLVLLTERLEAGVAALSRRLGLPLAARHERRSASAPELPDASRARLREMLAPEYALYERVAAEL
jgi:hypothetical protein